MAEGRVLALERGYFLTADEGGGVDHAPESWLHFFAQLIMGGTEVD
jgi:hypothetical protein